MYQTVLEKIARDKTKKGSVHQSERVRKKSYMFLEAKRDGEHANFFGGLIQAEM